MSSSILENEVWGFLHRAGLDNVHIEMCLPVVIPLYKYRQLNQDLQDNKAVRDLLADCGLPQIPLDIVMGALFPQENSREAISTIDQLGYAP